jgi:hypothetical protein
MERMNLLQHHPNGENKKIKGAQGASPLPGSGGARGLGLLFLCFIIFAICVIPAWAADNARDIAERLESSKRSLSLQTEIPEKSTKIEITGDADGIFRRIFWRVVRFFDEIRAAAKILLVVSIIVIALIIALHLRENLWSLSRAKKLEFSKNDAEARVSALERMEHSQAEADELARAGSFAEAMHVLLLRSVSEMRTRFASPIAVSLTSREILGRLEMSPEEREVFASIVGGVEISLFGAHNPREDEYLECRRNFDALTELLRDGRT